MVVSSILSSVILSMKPPCLSVALSGVCANELAMSLSGCRSVYRLIMVRTIAKRATVSAIPTTAMYCAKPLPVSA